MDSLYHTILMAQINCPELDRPTEWPPTECRAHTRPPVSRCKSFCISLSERNTFPQMDIPHIQTNIFIYLSCFYFDDSI